MTRTFSHRIAVRDKTPLLVGLVGPSSSGKTKSALRLADGFKRVNPGETFVIDTEAGRALQYADEHSFVHVPFGAPFGPLDYLDVIKYCIDNGAKSIVIDSMSHCHEGAGGVLEIQAAEFVRLGPKLQGLSWNKPKSENRRLINTILQLNCNFIFCFRAKEKLDWDSKPPKPLGFMAIGGGEWMYEMTAQCLLMPMARGVPTWSSHMPGEKETIKLPGQFEKAFAGNPQLSEDVGEALARWAAGSATIPTKSAEDMIAGYAACSESSEFRRLEESRRVSWASISAVDKAAVKSASESCARKIEDAAKAPEPTVGPAEGNEFTESAAAAG